MREHRPNHPQRQRPVPPPNYQQRQQKRPQPPYTQQKRQSPQQQPMGIRMQRNQKQQKELRRKRTIALMLFFVIVALLGVLAFSAFKLYASVIQWENKAEQSDFVVTTQTPAEADELINIAIFGTDKDGFRTDVNILASFHTQQKKLNLISIPRDTRVTMTNDMISYLEKQGRTVPQNNGVYGQCKFTEVHAYAGEGNRNTFSVVMMEELLDISIDYYVKIDLDAFKELVDEIGGVEFTVEQRLYYSDPAQNLYIDLYPGLQTLNGEQAEMLVRYRSGYAQGDLKRVQVQQDFLRAMITKITSSDTLLKNINGIIDIALEKSETNMKLTDALQYASYISQIDPATVTTDTIPGEGGAYFDMDEEATKVLIDWRIHGIEPPVEETNEIEESETIETTQQTDF